MEETWLSTNDMSSPEMVQFVTFIKMMKMSADFSSHFTYIIFSSSLSKILFLIEVFSQISCFFCFSSLRNFVCITPWNKIPFLLSSKLDPQLTPSPLLVSYNMQNLYLPHIQ
jgi:hypothetical protein